MSFTKQVKSCAVCGTSIPIGSPNAKKYCDTCAPQVKSALNKKWTQEHERPSSMVPRVPRVCQRCGADISSTAGSRKYCDSCQEIAHREKHVKSQAEYRAKITVPGFAGTQKRACPVYVIVCETCKRETIVLTQGQKKCPTCKKSGNILKEVMLELRNKILDGTISGIQEARGFVSQLVKEKGMATDAQAIENLVNLIVIDKRGVTSGS